MASRAATAHACQGLKLRKGARAVTTFVDIHQTTRPFGSAEAETSDYSVIGVYNPIARAEEAIHNYGSPFPGIKLGEAG